MAKFTFTALGKTFEVDAPAGVTEAQAKAVFDKQLNTGSLTGLTSGDILNAATQARDGLTAAVSQLGANAASAINSLSTQLPNLGNIPMPTTTNVASFVKQSVAQVKIGSLSPTQIQGLVSQAATQVGQAANVLTNANGLGKFGLNPTQLEKAGLLKPGTAKMIAATGASITSVLGSPASWTGKNGATNLASVLNNEKLQNTVQQKLMASSFEKLGQIGAITKNLDPAKLGPIVQNAAKFGPDVAKKWLAGTAPANLVGQLNNFAKGAQFGAAFAGLNEAISGGGSPLVTAVKELKGFSNTVNRATVNQGATSVIGNAKIPSPKFQAPPKVTAQVKADFVGQLKALQDEKDSYDTEYAAFYNSAVSTVRNPAGALADYVQGLITQAESLRAKAIALEPKFQQLSEAAVSQSFDVGAAAARASGQLLGNQYAIDALLRLLTQLLAKLNA